MKEVNTTTGEIIDRKTEIESELGYEKEKEKYEYTNALILSQMEKKLVQMIMNGDIVTKEALTTADTIIKQCFSYYEIRELKADRTGEWTIKIRTKAEINSIQKQYEIHLFPQIQNLLNEMDGILSEEEKENNRPPLPGMTKKDIFQAQKIEIIGKIQAEFTEKEKYSFLAKVIGHKKNVRCGDGLGTEINMIIQKQTVEKFAGQLKSVFLKDEFWILFSKLS